VPAARGFLEARVETSLFLLASLDRYGPRVTEIPTSGDYYEVTIASQIAAVFAFTRKGHLLVQTGGRRDLVPAIVARCQADGLAVTGVVAEWTAAEAIHAALSATGALAPTYVSKNLVCHRQMHHDDYRQALDHVRRLRAGDFDEWFRLYAAFLSDQGAETLPSRADLRGPFERRSAAGWWWGAFDGPRLAGIVAVDEVYRTTCQIGGLYVSPEARRRGLARALMAGLQRDCLEDAPGCRMVLFVRTANRLAQTFYDGLGFQRAGHFALIW
jgi:ribosomal protein S18 acetylase RimI-like enzyme